MLGSPASCSGARPPSAAHTPHLTPHTTPPRTLQNSPRNVPEVVSYPFIMTHGFLVYWRNLPPAFGTDACFATLPVLTCWCESALPLA
jgi:hypothetical protein